MGWWSADIMGGDTPLDHKYELELKGDSLNSMTALAWIETKKTHTETYHRK